MSELADPALSEVDTICALLARIAGVQSSRIGDNHYVTLSAFERYDYARNPDGRYRITIRSRLHDNVVRMTCPSFSAVAALICACVYASTRAAALDIASIKHLKPDQLARLYATLNAAYYRANISLVHDTVYDAIERELERIDPGNPLLKHVNGVYQCSTKT